jgi:hypothetical protein
VECLSVWSLDLSKVIWNPRRDNLVQAGDPTMYRSVPDPAAPLRWTSQPRLVRFISWSSLMRLFVTSLWPKQLDWFTMIHLYSNDWTCAVIGLRVAWCATTLGQAPLYTSVHFLGLVRQRT